MHYLNEPWEQIPFSFHFPYYMVWFLSPDGYIDGYMLDYGSFTLCEELNFQTIFNWRAYALQRH